jgi:hypothetical protein
MDGKAREGWRAGRRVNQRRTHRRIERPLRQRGVRTSAQARCELTVPIVIIQVKEIAFIYYQVTDIARARRFYEELLRLTVGVEYEGAPGTGRHCQQRCDDEIAFVLLVDAFLNRVFDSLKPVNVVAN